MIYLQTKEMNDNKHNVLIDGISIPVETLGIYDLNVMQVTAGTNGHQGGDTGHGGRTYFSLACDATDMRVKVIEKYRGACYETEDADTVEIVFGGDAELDTFIQALEFTLQTLKEQLCNQ